MFRPTKLKANHTGSDCLFFLEILWRQKQKRFVVFACVCVGETPSDVSLCKDTIHGVFGAVLFLQPEILEQILEFVICSVIFG